MDAKATILIVDDSPLVARLLREVLASSGYDCTTAHGAEAARREMDGKGFDLILTDMHMPPGMSGLELIRDMQAEHPDISAIMMTGLDSPETGRIALEMGAYGYVVKPFNNSELLFNINSALIRRRLDNENRAFREGLKQQVLERTHELMETIHRLEHAEGRLRRSQEETIQRLAMATEYRDSDTGQHVVRMSHVCELLAHAVGLPAERCELVRLATPMHDIGKIAIKDSILRKPGKFTPEERGTMEQHAEFGHRMLSGSQSELLRLASVIAWTHHEKFDGSGYPRGLEGEEIPLEGRITAVADVFDALTSKRPYKEPFSVDEALNMLREGSGTHFDPDLIAVFAQILPQVNAILGRYSGG